MKKFDQAVELLKIGSYKKAQKILEEIVSKKPKFAPALINLGIAYKNQGQLVKAIETYQKAIKLKVKAYAAYNNLANIYLARNEFDLAKTCFLKAISLKPDYAEAHANLGAYYQTKNNKILAKRYYNKAIKLNSNPFDVLFNFSSILEGEGNYKKALLLARKALEIESNNTNVYSIIANSLRGLDELKEAREYYEKAIKIDPYMTSIYPNLLDVLFRLGDKKEANKIHKKMDELGAETPYWALKLHKSLKHRLDIARSFSERIRAEAQRTNVRLGYWVRRKREKIKVGYIYNQIEKPFFKLHDKSKFEIHTFSYSDIRNYTDAQVAKRINKKRIEILVDLVGHGENNRMGIFAHRPSPFQFSYLGFSGTSGANFIEYKIVDRKIPKKDAKYYSEKLICIPNCDQIGNKIYADKIVKKLEEVYTEIVTAKKPG